MRDTFRDVSEWEQAFKISSAPTAVTCEQASTERARSAGLCRHPPIKLRPFRGPKPSARGLCACLAAANASCASSKCSL